MDPIANAARNAVALPSAPADFAGRRAELTLLREELRRAPQGADVSSRRPRVLVVAGRPGSGRTALALRLAQELAPEQEDVWYVRLRKPDGSPVPPEAAAALLLRAVGSALRLPLTEGRTALPEPAPRAGADAGALRPGRGDAGPGSGAGADGGIPQAGRGADAGALRAAGGDTAPAPRAGADVGALRAGRGDAEPGSGAGADGCAPRAGRGDTSPGPAAGSAAGGVTSALRAPAAALGAPAPGGFAAFALRRALAGRRFVLVLDDVVESAQVEALLAEDAPEATVVAVSDGPLVGVSGARPCVVGGLEHAAGVQLLVGLAGETRIVVDPVAAHRLVEELAGHPGALRLAGAWLKARPRASVTDVLRELKGEAGKLPGTARPAAEPLLRAFELVYAGLGAAPQRLLRLIALAPAGLVDARTASALLGAPVEAAQALLDALAAQELTVRQGAHHRLPGWARPVVGALAAVERPAEVELARARLLEREIRLLGAAVHRLGGGPEPEPLPAALRLHSAQQAWDWLDAELPVLRALTSVEGLDGAVLRLATLLVRALPLWAGGGADLDAELYRLHDRVRELARRAKQPRREAAALLNLGDLHARAGEHERALERYRAALAPAKAAEDQLAVGRILEAAAGAYRASGDLVRAVDWYGRALGLRRKRGERAEEARLLERLAATHCAQGRQAEAVREYRSAAGARRKLGDQAGLVGTLLGLARAQEPQGAEPVLRTLREALDAARRAGDGRQAVVLLRMAEVLEGSGDAEGARLTREQARALGAGPGTAAQLPPARGNPVAIE